MFHSKQFKRNLQFINGIVIKYILIKLGFTNQRKMLFKLFSLMSEILLW